ncbi:MAG: zinc ribbon domain-containing protein [Methanobacterium sp.]
MVFCPKCGKENKDDADFCKICGYNLKGTNKNLITRLNNKINILGVFIGLIISLLVLLILSLLSGMLVASGKLNIIGFAYIVLLSMMFIGGFVTSILSCRTYSEGLANGGFLGVVALVNFGFIIGTMWFSTMAVVSSLANAFGSFGGSSSGSSITGTPYNPTGYTSATNTSFNDMLPLIEIILLPFLVVLLAMAGGWVGVFIKKLLEGNISGMPKMST